MEYQTIGEFTRYLKLMFDTSTKMRNVYLKGEISNLKIHTTGHIYFSLKDETSKINAMMFASSAKNLNFVPAEGMKVLVHGRVSIYEATGNYQIYVSEMEEDGLGNTDIAILRMGIYELMYTDTPDIVCINEAVELAKEYSDDDVRKMINACLDKIYHNK